MEFNEKSDIKEDLIISLIHQDLRHNQLTEGLSHLGLEDGGLYCIDILSIVGRLMDVPEGEADDRWSTLYVSFMNEVLQYGVSGCGKELKPLAEKCYEMLVACAEIERRIQ